jgi:hypothetical protein
VKVFAFLVKIRRASLALASIWTFLKALTIQPHTTCSDCTQTDLKQCPKDDFAKFRQVRDRNVTLPIDLIV